MSKNTYTGLFLTLVWTLNLVNLTSFAQNSFVQINAGYDILQSIDVGINFEIEKKYPNHKNFTFSLGYNYIKFPEGGISVNGVLVQSLTLETKSLSVKAKWFPIPLDRLPFSLLYISAGPMYSWGVYNKITAYHGPGIAYGIGIQAPILKKIVIGGHFESGIFYGQEDKAQDIKTPGYSFSIRLGYRFNKKGS